MNTYVYIAAFASPDPDEPPRFESVIVLADGETDAYEQGPAGIADWVPRLFMNDYVVDITDTLRAHCAEQLRSLMRSR